MVGLALEGFAQGNLCLTGNVGISRHDEQFCIGIPFICGCLGTLELQDPRLGLMGLGKIAQSRLGFCQKLVALDIRWPRIKSRAQLSHQLHIVRVRRGVRGRRARLCGLLV